MTAAERERFHNLLLMAKESPFEGERSNALEAAERMAKRNGLTLEEAARSEAKPCSRLRRHASNSLDLRAGGSRSRGP